MGERDVLMALAHSLALHAVNREAREHLAYNEIPVDSMRFVDKFGDCYDVDFSERTVKPVEFTHGAGRTVDFVIIYDPHCVDSEHKRREVETWLSSVVKPDGGA